MSDHCIHARPAYGDYHWCELGHNVAGAAMCPWPRENCEDFEEATDGS